MVGNRVMTQRFILLAMSKSKESPEKQGSAERLSRFGRNFNALGAVALAGLAVVIPGPNVILGTWAGLNAAQAGGFELLRRHSANKRKKKMD